MQEESKSIIDLIMPRGNKRFYAYVWDEERGETVARLMTEEKDGSLRDEEGRVYHAPTI